MIFDYAGIQQLLPVAICIQVTSQHAGLPLCGAHLYTKREKEEVINSGNGQYRLLTWQPLPATPYYRAPAIRSGHRNYHRDFGAAGNKTAAYTIK